VASFAVSVGLAGLLNTLGCGSRTSMLDPDAYDPGTDNVSGGGSRTVDPPPVGVAGKPSTGGSSVGIGGSSVATGGSSIATSGSSSTIQGGASGVDPSLSVQICQQYCPGYALQCGKRLNGQPCMPTCEAELDGSGPVCQSLGVQTLICLTPFFGATGEACEPAVNRALTACGAIAAAFTDCKAGGGKSGPKQPTPFDIASCKSAGSAADPSDCKALFSCPNGQYETYCSTSQTGISDCACISPNGSQTMGRFTQSTDVCFRAASVCQ
jgi:hypothetical protein